MLFGGRLGPYDSKEQRQYFLAMLDNPWDIHSRRELLKTVTYMSTGPGFQKCRTKADQAWAAVPSCWPSPSAWAGSAGRIWSAAPARWAG